LLLVWIPEKAVIAGGSGFVVASLKRRHACVSLVTDSPPRLRSERGGLSSDEAANRAGAFSVRTGACWMQKRCRRAILH
jgi:hypothetical protein